MGNFVSVSTIAICATLILAAASGVILEQINQKLELLERSSGDRKQISKNEGKTRMVGWHGRFIDNLKEDWIPGFERNKAFENQRFAKNLRQTDEVRKTILENLERE